MISFKWSRAFKIIPQCSWLMLLFKCTWCCYLKGHKFVIWLGCPGIYFHRILQSNYEKFDSFIFYWKNKQDKHNSVSTQNSKFFWLSFINFIKMTSTDSSKPTKEKCWSRSSFTISFSGSLMCNTGYSHGSWCSQTQFQLTLVTTTEYLH